MIVSANDGQPSPPCSTDVAALGEFAVQRLGTVHRWINNAGQVTRKRLLADLEVAEIADVVGANVLGSLLCCRCGVRAPPASHCCLAFADHNFCWWTARRLRRGVTQGNAAEAAKAVVKHYPSRTSALHMA